MRATRMRGINPAVLLLLSLCLALFGEAAVAQFTRPGTLVLSSQEKAWIAAHPTVRIAFDGHFPPHSFIDESGQLVGMAVDTVQLISERTGIQFEIDKRTTWVDLYQAAEQREVDVVATIRSSGGYTQMSCPPQPLAMNVGRGALPGTTHHSWP